MSEPSSDPVVNELREQIAAADRALVELINRRLELVRQMRERKEEIGASYVDPAREEKMLTYIASLNNGPVSQEGLAELYRQVVALGKREVYGLKD